MDRLVQLVGRLLSELHAAAPTAVCPGDWAWTATLAGGMAALAPVLGAVLVAMMRRWTGNRYGAGPVLVIGATGLTAVAVLPWLLFFGTSEVFRGAQRGQAGAVGLRGGDLDSLATEYCFAPPQAEYLGGARTVRDVLAELPAGRPGVLVAGALLLVGLPLLAMLLVYGQCRLGCRRGPRWPARLLWLPMLALVAGTASLSATVVAHLWLGFLPVAMAGMLVVALVGAPSWRVIEHGAGAPPAMAPPMAAPPSGPRPAGGGWYGGPDGRGQAPYWPAQHPPRQHPPPQHVQARPGTLPAGPPRVPAPAAPLGAQQFGAAQFGDAQFCDAQFGDAQLGGWFGGQYGGAPQRGGTPPGPAVLGGQPASPAPGGQQPAGEPAAATPLDGLPRRTPTLPLRTAGPGGGDARPGAPDQPGQPEPAADQPPVLAADPGPLPETLQRALGLAVAPAEQPEPPTLPPSRFQRIRPLGSGGFGTVWLAMDTALDRTVAVKAAKVPDAETERRIRREARALAAVHHPNCVRVYDILTDADGKLAIIMEYVPGRSLTAAVEADGVLPDPAAARLWSTLAGALHAAHGKGVLHRDVKPANIVIDDAGYPHLIDFGIARTTGDVTLTAAGMVLGTPDYMAPEVAAGKQAGPAADAWQLAATVSFALAGVPPRAHRDGAVAAMLAAAQGEPCNQLPARSAHRGLLEQSLQPDPSRRPSLTTVQAELGRWLAATGQQPDGPVTERLHRPPAPAWPTQELP